MEVLLVGEFVPIDIGSAMVGLDVVDELGLFAPTRECSELTQSEPFEEKENTPGLESCHRLIVSAVNDILVAIR
jgi:hypothetical protein